MGCQAERQVEFVRVPLSEQRFDDAFTAAKELLHEHPDTHGTQALYLMGVIFAHPDNPKQNMDKAKEYLVKIGRFDERQQKIVRGEVELVLDLIETSREKKSLEKITAKLRKQVGQTQQPSNPDIDKADQKKEVIKLKNTVTKLKKEIASLKDQLEALKEIDLGIEEKKRETTLPSIPQ